MQRNRLILGAAIHADQSNSRKRKTCAAKCFTVTTGLQPKKNSVCGQLQREGIWFNVSTLANLRQCDWQDPVNLQMD